MGRTLRLLFGNVDGTRVMRYIYRAEMQGIVVLTCTDVAAAKAQLAMRYCDSELFGGGISFEYLIRA